MTSAPWLYKVSRFLMWVELRIWHRYRTSGVRNVPDQGGCILAGNHASFLDPAALGCAVTHRYVHFVTRQDLRRFRPFRWWADRVGALPLDRDKGDVAAMKLMLKVLKAGEALALFPEGTRTHDGQLQKAKGGLGFLISKAAVPVIPIYLAGTFAAFPRDARWIKPRPITVYYGPPISPAEIMAMGQGRENYEALADLVMARIAALKTEHEKAAKHS